MIEPQPINRRERYEVVYAGINVVSDCDLFFIEYVDAHGARLIVSDAESVIDIAEHAAGLRRDGIPLVWTFGPEAMQ